MKEITKNVYSVGALDKERRLFDEIIPLPDGTSYNSYLIIGSDKTALIDTVDPTKTKILLDNLKTINKIDYVIANHAEQDHSGSIPAILERYPSAKVVCNEKCKGMLTDLLHIAEDRFIVIKDRETLSLGDKTLEFIFAPWVHWPETMFTYLKEDHILFTCDFLGSHLATDEMYGTKEKAYNPAKRYYAEIMMPFRNFIRMHLEKIKDLNIAIIAPSHGPMYKDKWVIDSYKEWVSDDVKNEALIGYVSMHGSTEQMALYLAGALKEKGIEVKLFNLVNDDIGEFAMATVDAATIVIASPAFLIGLHPVAANALFIANVLKPKVKYISIIGSYGWGSKLTEQAVSMIPNLKAEILEPIMAKGLPKENNILDPLVDKITAKHKEAKILK